MGWGSRTPSRLAAQADLPLSGGGVRSKLGDKCKSLFLQDARVAPARERNAARSLLPVGVSGIASSQSIRSG